MKICLIIKAIYDDIFCHTFSQSCYVFLCGGAGKECIRNKVRSLLVCKNFQILYPEDLFMDMFNKDKKSDLLDFENFLAENSDIICIIIESIGSAVELGAFIQNDSIKRKMVVAINQKYSRDKSFLMMGPIKHLKKIDKDKIVIFKHNDLKLLCDNLSRGFRKIHKQIINNKNLSFNSLSTYIVFIPMIVYFFRIINRKKLYKSLKDFIEEVNITSERYKVLFNAAIKYLIRTGAIITEFDISNNDETLIITPKGYNDTIGLIKRSSSNKRTLLHDKIRCVILKMQLYNSRSF